MSKLLIPHWSSIHTIVFDFDGVFTDNKVWTDQFGTENVCCDRGDGLAFDMLRKFVNNNDWDLHYFILSKEENPVVLARAKKLKIPCIQGSMNKLNYLVTYLKENDRNTEGVVYVGNDLNDLGAMRFVGCSVAPSDAHPLILQQASVVLPQKGGSGLVRALIEHLLKVDQMSIYDIINLV